MINLVISYGNLNKSYVILLLEIHYLLSHTLFIIVTGDLKLERHTGGGMV